MERKFHKAITRKLNLDKAALTSNLLSLRRKRQEFIASNCIMNLLSCDSFLIFPHLPLTNRHILKNDEDFLCAVVQAILINFFFTRQWKLCKLTCQTNLASILIFNHSKFLPRLFFCSLLR